MATTADFFARTASSSANWISISAEIDIQLAELEAVLAKKSAVVAIAEGYPSSIERIGAWTADLAAKNFVLAPLSALANKQVKK